ncbi:hypothetical protein, partial [Alicyclobacillus fructus]|uniref:hypothetical protein n=1 Tax=Alicyclobacillus fructus TaxID=2816082 RepID=UPI001A8D20E8
LPNSRVQESGAGVVNFSVVNVRPRGQLLRYQTHLLEMCDFCPTHILPKRARMALYVFGWQPLFDEKIEALQFSSASCAQPGMEIYT